MRTMTRAALAVLIAGMAFSAVTAAALSPREQDPLPAAGTVQDRFPEATGKAPLLKVCSNCHSAESVVQSLRTRQEWSDVVDQMARFGAEASDQEFDQILSYLLKYFSPIAINKAAAKDLQAALGFAADAADAIVAYRAEKGDFKTIDDVKKVPGLEAGTVEVIRFRLVF